MLIRLFLNTRTMLMELSVLTHSTQVSISTETCVPSSVLLLHIDSGYHHHSKPFSFSRETLEYREVHISNRPMRNETTQKIKKNNKEISKYDSATNDSHYLEVSSCPNRSFNFPSTVSLRAEEKNLTEGGSAHTYGYIIFFVSRVCQI